MSEFRAGLRRRPKIEKMQTLAFKKGNNVCNICRQKTNLTDDHLPPRCCGNNTPIMARRVSADELIAQQVDAKSRNGLKFRTLCRACNGDLLGAWDEALGDFSKRSATLLSSPVALPGSVSLSIRAGAVLRSVLGHVVAAKVEDDQVPIDQKIRDYLLGKSPLDGAIKVYCWLYPFEPTVVARDFTFVEVEGVGGKSPGIVSVVKFFPLAFCVLDGKGDLNPECVTPLHQFSALDPQTIVDIKVSRKPIVHPGRPERAMGNHIVLGGKSYVDSVTTAPPASAAVTPGKRVQAERWAGGDNAVFQDLHAFVEIPED